MDIHEIALLEILMDRVSCQGTYTEHSLEGVSSRTQVGDGTQILKAVAFLLKRIIRSGRSLNGYLGRLNLERLLCLRGRNQGTFYDNGCAYV